MCMVTEKMFMSLAIKEMLIEKQKVNFCLATYQVSKWEKGLGVNQGVRGRHLLVLVGRICIGTMWAEDDFGITCEKK